LTARRRDRTLAADSSPWALVPPPQFDRGRSDREVEGEAMRRAIPVLLALEKAQVTLLANPATAHPYYWAPFILIGAR
jgi:CHAT domain